MAVLLRLLFLCAIAWILFRFVQRALGLPGPARPEVDRAGPEAMRRCDYCQVHVPEGESTRSRGHFFCCEAHRDAYFRGHR